MSANRSCAVAMCLLAAATGCYRATGPASQPTPQQSMTSAFGGWITVTLVKENLENAVAGELIAVGADTMHVLSPAGLVSISRVTIKSLALERYRVEMGATIVATILGALSTIGNGYFMILTAPAWIAAGTASAAMYSRAPVTRSASDSDLRAFSRFPQGIPANVDRSRLVLRGAALKQQ